MSPMPLAVLRQPFDHPDWLFEVKYDGFRALAYFENGVVRLVSRKGTLYKSFDALSGAIGGCLGVRDAVLDGEIVYLGPDGKPQFYTLLWRQSPQHFMAFDLLWLNGRDLRRLPLVERKRLLGDITHSEPVVYTSHIEERGTELFRVVCEAGLEGIVAKLKAGLYTPEETSWVKIKNPAYSPAMGRREWFERRRALVAGG